MPENHEFPLELEGIHDDELELIEGNQEFELELEGYHEPEFELIEGNHDELLDPVGQ